MGRSIDLDVLPIVAKSRPEQCPHVTAVIWCRIRTFSIPGSLLLSGPFQPWDGPSRRLS